MRTVKLIERTIGSIGIIGLFYSIYILIFEEGFGALIIMVIFFPLSLLLSIFFLDSFIEKQKIPQTSEARPTKKSKFSPMVVIGAIVILGLLILSVRLITDSLNHNINPFNPL